MLKAISEHRVGDRFGRMEPRANKRRPKAQKYLMQPRKLARKRLLVGREVSNARKSELMFLNPLPHLLRVCEKTPSHENGIDISRNCCYNVAMDTTP